VALIGMLLFNRVHVAHNCCLARAIMLTDVLFGLGCVEARV
jgi:hypothetical protein